MCQISVLQYNVLHRVANVTKEPIPPIIKRIPKLSTDGYQLERLAAWFESVVAAPHVDRFCIRIVGSSDIAAVV